MVGAAPRLGRCKVGEAPLSPPRRPRGGASPRGSSGLDRARRRKSSLRPATKALEGCGDWYWNSYFFRWSRRQCMRPTCPRCGEKVARRTAARIEDGMRSRPGPWVHVVVTARRPAWFAGKATPADFVDFGARLSAFTAAVFTVFKSRFIASIQAQSDGSPHADVLLDGEFAALATTGGTDAAADAVEALVRETGLGWEFSVGSLPFPPEEAGYIVKTSQVAKMAPSHFRRLRASRGLLPPTGRPRLRKRPTEPVQTALPGFETRVLPPSSPAIQPVGKGYGAIGGEFLHRDIPQKRAARVPPGSDRADQPVRRHRARDPPPELVAVRP